jgi:putative transposase
VRRLQLFHHDGDYRAFLSVMVETLAREPIRLYTYCLMPNHFHLVCSPQEDGQLSGFMRLMTLTHSKRWHAARGTTGTGCVYQGRFKAFPIQADSHFLTVCRYVERNPLRARLVRRAEDWPFSSLADKCKNSNIVPLCPWPILQPSEWVTLVNQVEPELEGVRRSVARSLPFGGLRWTIETADRLGLTPALGGIGRPSEKLPG